MSNKAKTSPHPNRATPEVPSSDEQITSQFRYIKDLARLKYETEEQREQALIQQSSQMQTVFSFVTAALFMAMTICIQNREPLSLDFFLISISIITFFLLMSLVFASISQWRWKTKTFPDIKTIKQEVIGSSEWQKLCIEYYQIDQWIDLIGRVQEEKAILNNRRVHLIMASMVCFYIAIASILITFILGISMIVKG